MSSNRFVLAALAGGVVIFVAGFVLYTVVMADFFAANMGSAVGAMKEQPDFVHLALGQLVLGLYLAVVIDKWARVGGLAAGLKIGAISGLLIGLGYDLTMFGVSNMANITATLVDPLVTVAQMALGGAAIGAVLGPRTQTGCRATQLDQSATTDKARCVSNGSKSRSLCSSVWPSRMHQVAMRQSMVVRTVTPRARSVR